MKLSRFMLEKSRQSWVSPGKQKEERKNDNWLFFKQLVLRCTIGTFLVLIDRYFAADYEYQVGIFTSLPALRLLASCNVLYVYESIRAIPTYRVYRLYDDDINIVFHIIFTRTRVTSKNCRFSTSICILAVANTNTISKLAKKTKFHFRSLKKGQKCYFVL